MVTEKGDKDGKFFLLDIALYVVMAGDAAASLQSWVLPKGHNCSHEIKRYLFFGRKAMTNLDIILKSRDIKD